MNDILMKLHDSVQSMRENGETDLRSVLHLIDNAFREVKEANKKPVITKEEYIEAAPKGFSLYELTSNYLQVQDLSEEMDAETLKDTLDSIEESFNHKAENICKLMQMNDSEGLVLDNEIKRLQERKKALGKKNDQLKDYLFHHMKQTDMKEVKSTLFSIKIKKNPHKINILDESAIAPFYYKQKVTHELDKKELLKDLKAGLEIDGVTLVQETRLEIK